MRGPRGPAPTPNVVKLLRGNPGKRAIRPEPQPEIPPQVPEPPPILSGPARAEWVRLAGELWRLRLLSVADLMPFAAYCQAFARWRAAEEALERLGQQLVVRGTSGDPIANPLLRISRQAAADMVHFGAHFGLSPSAWARIASGAWHDPGGGKFGDLLA